MGKWTIDYYDDVLGAKLKGIVNGAIKRSILEKSDPTITYETFVEDLDSGDSFTTTMIDILVKELAERRTRQAAADRRLIADRTAKSLRMLATPLRVYRDRPTGRFSASRRSVNLNEYLSAAADEMDMEEDEDEYEGMFDHTSSLSEGARLNADLYDAYTQSWSLPSSTTVTRISHSGYSAAMASAGTSEANTLDSVLPSIHSPPTQARGSSWTFFPSPSQASGSLLARQPSLRRPTRSRAVDFNDFASRRRSAIRQSAAQEVGSSRSEGGSEDRTLPTPARSPVPEEPTSTAPVRRFFPFSRSRRHDSVGGVQADSRALSADADEHISTARPSDTFRPLYMNHIIPGVIPNTSSSHSSPAAFVGNSSESGPRLRRGGVRAPEVMMSRPPPVAMTIAGEQFTLPGVQVGPNSEGSVPSNDLRQSDLDTEDTSQLPTPRSENEDVIA